jgi:hypothetical protein
MPSRRQATVLSLDLATVQLCGVLLRKAGHTIDDIEVQLSIEHIQAGKEPTKPWHPLLVSILRNLYNEGESNA